MPYLNWIGQLNQQYGDLIQVLPADTALFRAAADKVSDVRQRFATHLAAEQERLRQLAAHGEIPGTLHQALDDYIAHLKSRTGAQDHSGWADTQAREAETLR